MTASTCPTGKRQYNNRKQAKPPKNTHGRMHAYQCPECSFWHLGHSAAIGGGRMTGNLTTAGLRPRPSDSDLVSSFVVVGQHQVLLGSVILELTTAPPPAGLQLIHLGLPEALLGDLADLNDQRVVDAILRAPAATHDAIRSSWNDLHRGGTA